MSITPAISTEIAGPEPFVVRAARPTLRMSARGRRFELDPEDSQQLLAIRLLLRLLITWPGARHPPGLDEDGEEADADPRQGPHLRYGRMRLANRQDALHAVVADPEPTNERDQNLSPATEIRRALREILRARLGGLQHAFPVGTFDALDLDVIEPDVDLVTVAEKAHVQCTRSPDEARGGMFNLLMALEMQTSAVFRSDRLDVHPHLAPFVEPLRRMHRDVLRHIVQAGPYVDESKGVVYAGERLSQHADGFDAPTAMAFLQAAVGLDAVTERYRTLIEAAGAEKDVPGPARDFMSRTRQAHETRPSPVRPGDLRTAGLCRADEAPWEALGVHRADTRLSASGDLPGYVRRPEHEGVVDACRRALRGGVFSLVAVSGPSAAGKTRLLYEALREASEEAWVIAPHPRRAREAYRPAVHPRLSAARQVVLWLDDLELFIAGDGTGLTAADIEHLASPGQPPVLVLCTYDGRFRDVCAREPMAAAELERFLALATLRVRLDAKLDAAAEADACARFPEHAPEIRELGLGPALISASRLQLRYADRFPLHAEAALDAQEGLAFVDAALAWRELAARPYVSEAWAEVAWKRLRPLRGRRSPPTPEGWRAAQDWAAAEVAPGVSLTWWDPAVEAFRTTPVVTLPEQRRAQAEDLLAPVLQRWRASGEGRAGSGGES